MAEYAAWDVADVSHPAVPVDTAGYDPVIHHQTGSMVPSCDCYSGIQSVYDDGDRNGGSRGVGVAAGTLSTAVSAEAVASSAIIDIAALADAVD